MGMQRPVLFAAIVVIAMLPVRLEAAHANADWQRLVAAAKKEAKSSSARPRAAILETKRRRC